MPLRHLDKVNDRVSTQERGLKHIEKKMREHRTKTVGIPIVKRILIRGPNGSPTRYEGKESSKAWLQRLGVC